MLDLVLIILLIIVSLVALVKGADYLVDGAADIAKILRVSPMLVGLTVVAFGTSLPELMVSLFSAFAGSPNLSIGNIVGSNIFNIAAIIGISAVLVPLTIKSRTIMYEFPFLIISAFMLALLSVDVFIYNRTTFILSRLDALALLTLFGFFIYYIYLSARQDRTHNGKKAALLFKHQRTTLQNIIFIVGGLAALIVGGKLFTYAAQQLAVQAGLSESFIGLTIAAIGTSLPELFTSVTAAFKKQYDIAVGNILGSNIFNILFILGIVTLIHPLEVSRAMVAIDMMVMIGVSGLFLFFAGRYGKISRLTGITLLITYAFYFAWLVYQL